MYSYAEKTPGSVTSGSPASIASRLSETKNDLQNSYVSSQLKSTRNTSPPTWSHTNGAKNDVSYTQKFSGHGGVFIARPNEESGIVMSGQKAAKEWARRVNPTTKHIDLQSCHSAKGGPFSNAQMLSNKTGCTVTGYKGAVSNMSGDAQRFDPQSKLAASLTGKVNNLIGTVFSGFFSAFLFVFHRNHIR